MVPLSKTAQLLARKIRGTLSTQEHDDLEVLLRENPNLQTFIDTRLRSDRFAGGQKALSEMDEISLDEKMEQAISKLRYFQ